VPANTRLYKSRLGPDGLFEAPSYGTNALGRAIRLTRHTGTTDAFYW